jgi:hypothetical protein
MDNLPSAPNPQQTRYSEEIDQLEQDGQLLRVLRVDLQERIHKALKAAPNKTHPYVTVSGEQVYISLATLTDEKQRRQVYELLRHCQMGSDVDLSGLPLALQQLMQPVCTQPQRVVRSLLLAVAVGIAIGVLAMAVTVLMIAVTELVLHVSLDNLGGMRITAVSFVIFAVLGWLGAAAYFWRRMQS